MKGHTNTSQPTNSSITSQTTLYWGPACLTGNGFQTTPRTICDNICGQSCKKQIATKTHACLNQSGMGFGCDLLAGAQLLYHASCEKVGICPQLSQETLWPGALPRGGLSNNQNNGSKPLSETTHRRSVTAVRPSREPPACHLRFFCGLFYERLFYFSA